MSKQTFSVPEMNCGHCEIRIMQALSHEDAIAGVNVDLPARKVIVDSTVSSEKIIELIGDAGYSASKVEA